MGNVFGLPYAEINRDTSIDIVLDWDSLKHLILVVALEERFDVTLTEDETIEILNYNIIKMTLENHGIEFLNQ